MLADTLPPNAEDLIQQAWSAIEEENLELARSKARAALVRDPDSPEALLVLGHSYRQIHRRIDQYQKALESARGRLTHAVASASLWDDPYGPVYLRARASLARAFWIGEQVDDAYFQAEMVLQDDADDRMGIRFELAAWYLCQAQYDQVGELARIYGEHPGADPAFWYHALALCAYLRDGQTDTSADILRNAYRVNPHVLTQLLPEGSLHATPNPSISVDEALPAIRLMAAVWRHHPGGADTNPLREFWPFAIRVTNDMVRAQRTESRTRHDGIPASTLGLGTRFIHRESYPACEHTDHNSAKLAHLTARTSRITALGGTVLEFGAHPLDGFFLEALLTVDTAAQILFDNSNSFEHHVAQLTEWLRDAGYSGPVEERVHQMILEWLGESDDVPPGEIHSIPIQALPVDPDPTRWN